MAAADLATSLSAALSSADAALVLSSLINAISASSARPAHEVTDDGSGDGTAIHDLSSTATAASPATATATREQGTAAREELEQMTHVLVDALKRAGTANADALSGNGGKPPQLINPEQQQQQRDTTNEATNEDEDDDDDDNDDAFEPAISRRSSAADARELQAEMDLVKRRLLERTDEQARMEDELASRMDMLDNVRLAMRSLERENKALEKRYREQATSFDSARQSWLDSEQHYKMRIKSLAAKQASRRSSRVSAVSVDKEVSPPSSDAHAATSTSTALDDIEGGAHEASEDGEEEEGSDETTTGAGQHGDRGESGATTTTLRERALADELSSLSAAHASLSASMRAVTQECADLKSLTASLQDENESFQMLLSEQTFSKDFGKPGAAGGVLRRASIWTTDGIAENEDDERSSSDEEQDMDTASSRDVFEDAGDDVDVDQLVLESRGTGAPHSGALSSAPATPERPRRRASKARSSSGGEQAPQGALVDLAAELEAAQDAPDGEEQDERRKRAARQKRRIRSAAIPTDVEALRAEVRTLRDANKALTLYVSKIVERVCSQEGFEKVLAVDFRGNEPEFKHEVKDMAVPALPAKSEADDGGMQTPPRPPPRESSSSPSRMDAKATRSSEARAKRSLSLDWKSMWGALSPRPSAASDTPGRLPAVADDGDDEEDRLERERLRATLAEHGIEPRGNNWRSPMPSQVPIMGSLDAFTSPASSTKTPSLTKSPSSADGSSHNMAREHSGSTASTWASPRSVLLDGDGAGGDGDNDLADATSIERSLRDLDMRDQLARAELDEGRASGFTEPPPKINRRRSSRIASARRSSSSGGAHHLGLGIDGSLDEAEGDGDLGFVPSSKTAEISSAPPLALLAEAPPEGGDSDTWAKKLRRVSMRGWSAPSPTSTPASQA